jgi:hypothetical protein
LIFAGTGQQYLVEREVAAIRVTVHLRRVPYPQALRMVTRQAALVLPGLTIVRGGDVWVVRPRTYPAPGKPVPLPDARSPEEMKISVRLKKVPLREAARRVMRGSDLELHISVDVPDVPVTLDVRKVPRRLALYQMVRQVAAEVPNLSVLSGGSPWSLEVWHPAEDGAPAAHRANWEAVRVALDKSARTDRLLESWERRTGKGGMLRHRYGSECASRRGATLRMARFTAAPPHTATCAGYSSSDAGSTGTAGG